MTSKIKTSILKSTNHNLMINRIKHIETVSKVTPVEPISPINNNMTPASYNAIISSDEFYDKLSKLKKEYKKFYHDQKELEKVLRNIDQNSDCIVDNMKSLVGKYNIAINSLQSFDVHFHTNNRIVVENTLNSFKSQLADIGIAICDNNNLVFDEDKLLESISNCKDTLKFLFEPMKGLIISMYKVFRNIKIPKEDHVYYEYGGVSYNGIFTDESV